MSKQPLSDDPADGRSVLFSILTRAGPPFGGFIATDDLSAQAGLNHVSEASSVPVIYFPSSYRAAVRGLHGCAKSHYCR